MHLPVLYVKALHIIFVVTWFAGLFYIVRLFIYHAETVDRQDEVRNILQKQYKIMEKRLWYMITWPSMLLTLISGSWLVLPYLTDLLNYPWLLLKLVLVLCLVCYHLACGAVFTEMQTDIIRYSSFKLRIWNEVATLLLVSIVFVIVLKNTLNWIWGLTGFISLAVLLMLAIKWYRRAREKRRPLEKEG